MVDFNKFLKDSLAKAEDLTKNIDLNDIAAKSGELINNTTKAIADTAGSVINASVEKTQELASFASNKISEIEVSPQDVRLVHYKYQVLKLKEVNFYLKN